MTTFKTLQKYFGLSLLLLTPIYFTFSLGKGQYINGQGDPLYFYYFAVILGSYLYHNAVDKKSGILTALFIGFGSIILMVAIRHLKQKYISNQVNKFPATTMGVVTNCDENYKGRTKANEFDYSYTVDNNTYSKTVRENLNFKLGDTLVITYDKKEPHYHNISKKNNWH